MILENRLNSFVKLNQYFKNVLLAKEDQEFMHRAKSHNNWFTYENVENAIKGIITLTEEESLKEWVSKYQLSEVTTGEKVGIVMAGNIPMVGFHDLLSVVIAGHIAYVKLASDDKYLMTLLIEKLFELNPEIKEHIVIAERLNDIDAIIATGSNNSSRYFEHYFAHIPHIIRKNRNSIAILTGNETVEQLKSLGKDILNYFGLGCRNVAKLYVPEGYVFNTFFESVEEFGDIFLHHKYKNNYDYNKSVYLINMVSHLDNGFLILKEDKGMISPISVVFYETYASEAELSLKLSAKSDDIQCVVGAKNGFIDTVNFGESQNPGLFDYADGVDVLEFLQSLK